MRGTGFTETLHQAVELRGRDNRYEARVVDDTYPRKCLYVSPEGQPDCIIGFTLSLMGVSIPTLLLWEDQNAQEVMEGLHIGTAAEREAADVMQARQDDGHTYGTALGGYNETLDRLERK